jgi:hypothetical protein
MAVHSRDTTKWTSFSEAELQANPLCDAHLCLMVEDCQVKVTQFYCARVVQEDVLKLDITVRHTHSVHGGQRAQQGRSNLRVQHQRRQQHRHQ